MKKKNKTSYGILKSAGNIALGIAPFVFGVIAIGSFPLYVIAAAFEADNSKIKESSDYINYSFEYRRVIDENDSLSQRDKEKLTEENYIIERYIEDNPEDPLVQEKDKKGEIAFGAISAFVASASLAVGSAIANSIKYRENEDYHLNNAIGDNKNNNISNNDNLIDGEDIDLLNSDISFKV